MTDPYRAARDDEDRIAVAEPEVVVERSPRDARAAMVKMIAGIGAATVIALLVAHSVVLDCGVLCVAVVCSTIGAARIRARGRVVFRVESDALVMKTARDEESIALHTLDDIELETREVRKVGHDANPIMGLNFNQTVGPAVDVARIVLVQRKKPPLVVTEEWTSHTEATEAFRRLRLFLRARGWVPRSERPGGARARSIHGA